MTLRTFMMWYLGMAAVIFLVELASSWLGWNGTVAGLCVMTAILVVVLHKWIGLRTLWTWTREVCSPAFWKNLV